MAAAADAAPKTMRAVQYDKYGGGPEGLKVKKPASPTDNYSSQELNICCVFVSEF
jgi:hypothetical protein